MRIKTTALLAVAAATLALAACTPADADGDALPQASTATTAKAAPKASTCDVAREAILTGSAKDIAKALKALQGDKTADATAREYARYYLGRDKGNKDLQEMDVSLIQTSCSI